jgi:Tol biopolymer transport system component
MHAPTRSALTALSTLAATAALAPAAHAGFPGLNGRISLTQRVPAGPDGKPRANRDIFAYPRDGEAARARLTLSTDNEEQSAWSPDGRNIAYKRRDAVWVTRWDGTGATALTETQSDDSNNTQPYWTPDGEHIVFRSNRVNAPANIGDIWIMDAPTGADQHPLVERPGDERYPSMSPDGTRLLFRGDTDGISLSGDEEIFAANADGSDIRQLTHDQYADSSPAWSPDGSRIAFQSDRDGGDFDIFVMNADGTNLQQLTHNDIDDEGPAWSPDGRLIAFTRAENPDAPGDIWTMQADGSDQVALTDTPIIEESPDWQALPFDAGDQSAEHTACGDLSLAPGGVASVVTVRVPCGTGLRIARQWQEDPSANRVEAFNCAATRHSFDQQVVVCTHPGDRKAVAFVHRTP